MFVAGMTLFALLALTTVLDQVFFHRHRAMAPAERWTRWANPLFWTAAHLTAAFLPYSETTKPLLYGFGVLLVGLLIKEEYTLGAELTRGERALHAFGIFLTPLAFGLVAGIWPFVNGVSFFVGMVLPFGTDGLKQLMIGTGAFYAAWTIYAFLGFRGLGQGLGQESGSGKDQGTAKLRAVGKDGDAAGAKAAAG